MPTLWRCCCLCVLISLCACCRRCGWWSFRHASVMERWLGRFTMADVATWRRWRRYGGNGVIEEEILLDFTCWCRCMALSPWMPLAAAARGEYLWRFCCLWCLSPSIGVTCSRAFCYPTVMCKLSYQGVDVLPDSSSCAACRRDLFCCGKIPFILSPQLESFIALYMWRCQYITHCCYF